ncbi:MAG: hypothetical protein V4621_01495 [Pseudomonadota bacterium]
MSPSYAAAYTIYNVTPAPRGKKGAEWFRYGVLQDRTEAVQIARELFSSQEFARVEVHETKMLPAGGSRKSRRIKTFIRRDVASFLCWQVAAITACTALISIAVIF